MSRETGSDRGCVFTRGGGFAGSRVGALSLCLPSSLRLGEMDKKVLDEERGGGAVEKKSVGRLAWAVTSTRNKLKQLSSPPLRAGAGGGEAGEGEARCRPPARATPNCLVPACSFSAQNQMDSGRHGRGGREQKEDDRSTSTSRGKKIPKGGGGKCTKTRTKQRPAGFFLLARFLGVKRDEK